VEAGRTVLAAAYLRQLVVVGNCAAPQCWTAASGRRTLSWSQVPTLEGEDSLYVLRKFAVSRAPFIAQYHAYRHRWVHRSAGLSRLSAMQDRKSVRAQGIVRG
jgi:hypothetical protein